MAKYRPKILLFSVFVALLYVICFSLPALAAGCTGTSAGGASVSCTETETITGSGLSQSVTFGGLGNVAISTNDQISPESLTDVVSDLTGTGNGWNLQISATPFTNGTHTLPKVSVQPGTSTQVSTWGTYSYTDPNPGPSATGFVGDPTQGTPSPFLFFNANTNTGMGKFSIPVVLNVNIPANTFAGTYTSTQTVLLGSGPH